MIAVYFTPEKNEGGGYLPEEWVFKGKHHRISLNVTLYCANCVCHWNYPTMERRDISFLL